MKMRGFLALLWLTAACLTAADDKWVTTWGAAPLATNVPLAGAQPAPADPALLRSFRNQSIRMLINTSIGGRMARVELTNHFGQKPLKIGAAHVALHADGSKIVPGSDRVLTFGGNPSPVIPAGASMLSDPVDLAVPAIAQLAVSLFLPEDTGPPTQHVRGLHTTYISGEDLTGAPEIANPGLTTNSWYFLSAVHTLAPADTKVLVTFGDSITDGSTSTVDANANWPSQLARRLHEAGMNVAVVNAGIGGNRVLVDGTGVSALARFERDLLSVPGITHLIFMEGINDIGVTSRAGQTPVTAAEIIAIYRQMIDRARMRGIKVYGATLTPYDGAAYFSEGGEVTRSAVNQWIRTTGITDGVIDFDRVIRDPASPRKFRRDFTNTDFLHPNDAGYKAMAESINLELFR